MDTARIGARAKAAAEAMLKANSADAALAAETALRAAAAIHDFETATRDASASFTNRAIGTPQFIRTITLRGDFSPHALFSIDGLALPFRMLVYRLRRPRRDSCAANRHPRRFTTASSCWRIGDIATRVASSIATCPYSQPGSANRLIARRLTHLAWRHYAVSILFFPHDRVLGHYGLPPAGLHHLRA